MKKYFVVLFGIGILLNGCKKELQPELSEFNKGCDCAKEVSAEFVINEISAYGYNWERRSETKDTSYSDRNISFFASEENADYTWYIGTEILKTREVIRYFSSNLNGQTIPITLVTKKKINSICLPNDDGYDSITKYLTVVEDKTLYESGDAELNFEGSYKVKSPLLQDSIIITLDYKWVQQGAVANMLNIINYDGNGSDCTHGNVGAGLAIIDTKIRFHYKQIFINNYVISIGDALKGNIKLDNKKVEMNIITGGNVNGVYQQNLVFWQYKGRKL